MTDDKWRTQRLRRVEIRALPTCGMDRNREVVKGTLRNRYWTFNGRAKIPTPYSYIQRVHPSLTPQQLSTLPACRAVETISFLNRAGFAQKVL